MAPILRAFFGYFSLVFIVRVVGRRPGKQLTPFEFVLVFFMGGLALTAIVGNEASVTNALTSIMAIAVGHMILTVIRTKSPRIARLIDGTPLILLEHHEWRKDTLIRMGVQDDDVMAMARDHGISDLEGIDQAVLERNGEISVLPPKNNG